MNSTLRFGSRGSDVKTIQQGLNKILPTLPKLQVDGIYGAKSVGRVQAFQRAHFLVGDGIVGPLTWALFLALLSQLTQPPVQMNPMRGRVIRVAKDELRKPVHWAKYETRILEYFKYSTGRSFTKSSALTISWCSYFVHWCLWKAQVHPLPHVGGSIPRFLKSKGGAYKEHPVYLRNYTPMPGDMYYCPIPKNHIGIISEVRPSGNGYEIRTIDGNSGPHGYSPYFDMSEGRKIGYGFIYQPTGWRKLTNNDFYIQLC